MFDDDGSKRRAVLIMVRNAESEWNEQNLFCGWYDSPLSANGLEQAKAISAMIKKKKYQINIAYTSLLTRAQDTLTSILEDNPEEDIPIQQTWRLNPKHYGALTSWCKSELAGKYGEEQVFIWRRSFYVPPPPMQLDHDYFYEILDDSRYKKPEPLENVPLGESLQQVLERVLPYWNNEIIPQLYEEKTVLIAAHGNTIRALIKHIDNVPEQEIMNINVPNAVPFFYELNIQDQLQPCMPMRYMADESTTQKRIDVVIKQGKAE